ncbi:hypothetical protein PAXRUDRAFT_169402 [Paxillus rubicundulus Ve08.2h10]|uniref:Uncharacterized protein n=1 Tax=Paxillus rubicundulus Ve08.2h10 TaxID=930991 RepID=A0A0D0CZ97_9AGAM|nr:hypothetical protein PAXRUDRAFT_169402 [Paxillus rubicundulus Ve08.2h10]
MPVLEPVFEALKHCGLSVSEFILSLLTRRKYNDHPAVRDPLAHSPDIFAALAAHRLTDEKLVQRAQELTHEVHLKEIWKTAAEASGWHFGAYRSTTKQLEDFDLEKMAKDMEASAPHFWSLLGLFLGEARDEIVGGGPGPDDSRDADGDVVMGDESYWDEVDEIDLEGFINGLTSENGLMLLAADKRAK